MDKVIFDFKRIGIDEIDYVRELFIGVFTIAPWNDDWSDLKQLNLYLNDLMGQNNSLSYGLFENGELIGVSMGRIKHWHTGTEYCIDEFFIKANKQGKGLGTHFLEEMEKELKKMGIFHAFLQTEQNVPAYGFYQKNAFIELKKHVSFVKKI